MTDHDSAAEPRRVCLSCGAPAPTAPPPLTWMRQVDPVRGPSWVCADCVRRHTRAIEARLDEQWW